MARGPVSGGAVASKGAPGIETRPFFGLRVVGVHCELTNVPASSFLLNPLNYRIHVQVHGRKIAVFILLNEDRLWPSSRGMMHSSCESIIITN